MKDSSSVALDGRSCTVLKNTSILEFLHILTKFPYSLFFFLESSPMFADPNHRDGSPTVGAQKTGGSSSSWLATHCLTTTTTKSTDERIRIGSPLAVVFNVDDRIMTSLRNKAVYLVTTLGGLFWGRSFWRTRHLVLTSTTRSRHRDDDDHHQSYNHHRHRRRRIAVFYHLYVSDNARPDAIRRAHGILLEQMKQLGQSDLLSSTQRNDNNQTTTTTMMHSPRFSPRLYFNLVGGHLDNETTEQRRPVRLSPRTVLDVCHDHTSAECRLLRHYHRERPQRHEEVTLRALHRYCRRPDHVNDVVLYFHSKGSYRNRPYQIPWRRNMLHAITSQECFDALTTTTTTTAVCNVCGLVVFHLLSSVAGNFFVATCEYVRRLVDPVEDFPRQTATAVSRRRAVGLTPAARILRSSSSCAVLGLGRYANENWIGSHVAAWRPCDWSAPHTLFQHTSSTSPTADYWMRTSWEHALRGYNTTTTDRVAPAPRLSAARLGRDWNWWNLLDAEAWNAVLADPVARRRETFLLPGVLLRGLTAYGTLPPRSSWLWRWYPDGPYWRDLLLSSSSSSAEANDTATALRLLEDVVRNASHAQLHHDNGTLARHEEKLWQAEEELVRNAARRCFV